MGLVRRVGGDPQRCWSVAAGGRSEKIYVERAQQFALIEHTSDGGVRVCEVYVRMRYALGLMLPPCQGFMCVSVCV